MRSTARRGRKRPRKQLADTMNDAKSPSITSWTRQGAIVLSSASGTTLNPGVYEDIQTSTTPRSRSTRRLHFSPQQSTPQGLRVSGQPDNHRQRRHFYFTGAIYLAPTHQGTTTTWMAA